MIPRLVVVGGMSGVAMAALFFLGRRRFKKELVEHARAPGLRDTCVLLRRAACERALAGLALAEGRGMRSIVLTVLLIMGTGCPGDGGPCSSPETLFPSPQAVGFITDAGVQVDVTWTATSAPSAFYGSPRVAGAVLLDAGVTGAQVLSTSPVTPLEFELRYFEGPTRTCRHLGMDDTYVLSVSLPRLADGGVGPGTITTDVDLGAL